MSHRGRYQDDFCTQFQRLSVYDQPSTSQGYARRRSTPPKLSAKNPNLLHMNHHGNRAVTYQNLHPSNEMYQTIQNLITNKSIIIENIVEVYNPFLQQAYALKKVQKQEQFGEVSESLLFHGTKKANVGNICTYNFDWRLFGSNTGHKYGKGVSFSANAKYASYYSDSEEYHKVMVVAKVLIAKVCEGHSEMAYPPPGYDTSQKGNNRAVIVKYEDHEFYPAYMLYYHLDEGEECEEDYYYDQYNNYNDYYDENDGACYYDYDEYDYDEYDYDEYDYDYSYYDPYNDFTDHNDENDEACYYDYNEYDYDYNYYDYDYSYYDSYTL